MAWWRRRRDPPISHAQALRRLAGVGFAPHTVYDVRAFHGDWSNAAAKIFPTADYILFEANADNEPTLKATGRRHLIATLSGEDGAEKTLYLPRHAVATGASLYRENTEHYAGDNLREQRVVTRRLDTIVAAQSLPPPDLIKLDVQGAELEVLAGAPVALAHCGALIAELSFLAYNEKAPLIAEVVAGIDRLGFKCVDICEIHRVANDVVLQIDMLFVNPPLFEKFRARAGLG